MASTDPEKERQRLTDFSSHMTVAALHHASIATVAYPLDISGIPGSSLFLLNNAV
jgi:hypothetical protein